METKSTNSKGKSGEEYIDEVMKLFGWKAIKCDWWQSAVDRLYFKDGVSLLAQTKYKNPRIVYPDTGLEKYKFQNLKEMSRETGLRAIILFTDDTGDVYGNFVDRLKEEVHGGEFNKRDNVEMIYFWLRDLKTLMDVELTMIKTHLEIRVNECGNPLCGLNASDELRGGCGCEKILSSKRDSGWEERFDREFRYKFNVKDKWDDIEVNGIWEKIKSFI